MTSGVEKSSDKRKRERSGDERYIEAKGSEAVVDGDRCKKKMYKEEREKDRGKEVRKEERKEGRTRKDEAEKEEWNSLRSSMRAKWSAKTETARCATASSVGRTQGLPATSAEGSFTTLPFLFFVDFFQLFETAYETSCSLSLSFFYSAPSRGTRTILSMIAEEDFTSISPRNLQLRTQMIRLRRDAIIEMSFPAENKCLLPSSDFLLPVSVF